MADFKQAHKITMAHEGGYANHPKDRGGETYKGIARKFWPKWEGWKYVDALPKNDKILQGHVLLQEAVLKFYKANFWDVNNLDRFSSQLIANEMYDTGINMGTNVAAMFLQRALNVCNQNGTLFKDLKVDGDIGAMTLQALERVDSSLVCKILNALQGARYVGICENDRTQEVFVRSWFSRV